MPSFAIDPPFIRTPYNYDKELVSTLTAIDVNFLLNPETGELEDCPSMTQQQFAEEADINEIVRRFGLTGELPENYKSPVSGDFTGISDFKSAMDAVLNAQAEFDQLPGELRERFRHDPQELIDFVGNADNREEAIKLGLVPKAPEKTRDVVQAVDELAAKIVPPVK